MTGIRTAVVVGNPRPRSRTLSSSIFLARSLTGTDPDVVVDLALWGARLLDWHDPDVSALVAEVGRRVADATGVELQPELHFVGFDEEGPR